MGLFDPFLRAFRKPRSSENPPALPLTTLDPSSTNSSDQTQGESTWFRAVRLPFRRSGVRKVKVNSTHYLGFNATDSGYASRNPSGNDATRVSRVNPAFSDTPPATSSSDATTLVNSSVSTNGVHGGQTSLDRSKPAKDAAPPSSTPVELKRMFARIAYAAVCFECPEAINTIQYIKALQKIAAQHFESGTPWDPPVVWNDHAFLLSQVCGVGQDWIDRVDFAHKLHELGDKRLVHPEDVEDLALWLFPENEGHVLSVTFGRVMINNLVDEGCLTRSEGDRLAALVLTVGEVKDHGRVVERNDVPPPVRVSGVFSQLPLLQNIPRYRALQHLCEAVVFRISERGGGVWRGLRYHNARAEIKLYIQAYEGAEKGYVRPELVKYARTWTPEEKRLLERCKMVLNLLERWETGAITDFGVVKYTRNSLFRIHLQPAGGHENLAEILYSKVEGSGMSCDEVPQIVALLPYYDECHERGGRLLADLKSNLATKLMEYKQTNKQIAKDHKAAKKAYKAFLKGMGKMNAAALMEAPARPFDPFANHRVHNPFNLNHRTRADLSMHS